MSTHIIRDFDLIKQLTGNSNLNQIILKLDNKKHIAKYLDNYTCFELYTKLNYDTTVKILKENNLLQ